MVLDPSDEETRVVPPVREGVHTPSDAPEYALVVHKGHQAGRTWLLLPGVTRVGRHPYSDIALDHITVSRRHCRIRLDSNGLSLRDLSSTNGSYVNDRLVEETPLRAGDRLMIGTFHLLVARGR
jgi:pSer/pThr/pTyr-binding forkhead associated (FHA) protein